MSVHMCVCACRCAQRSVGYINVAEIIANGMKVSETPPKVSPRAEILSGVKCPGLNLHPAGHLTRFQLCIFNGIRRNRQDFVINEVTTRRSDVKRRWRVCYLRVARARYIRTRIGAIFQPLNVLAPPPLTLHILFHRGELLPYI